MKQDTEMAGELLDEPVLRQGEKQQRHKYIRRSEGPF